MTPEQVLSCKPARLTQRQRELYFENGYLLLERTILLDIIERLRGAVWDLDGLVLSVIVQVRQFHRIVADIIHFVLIAAGICLTVT